MWADYLIVGSFVFFVLGLSIEGRPNNENIFIKDGLTNWIVNAIGVAILVIGLRYQDYSLSEESSFNIVWQIIIAFHRTFSVSDVEILGFCSEVVLENCY